MIKEFPKELLKLIFTVRPLSVETKFASGHNMSYLSPLNLRLTKVNYMILSEYARRFVPGRKIVSLSRTCHRTSFYFTSYVMSMSLLSVTSQLCVSRPNMLSIDPAWFPLHTCTSFLCSKSIEPVCLPLGWSWLWVGEGFLLSIWLTHSSSFLNLTTKLSIFGSRVELYFYLESCLVSTLSLFKSPFLSVFSSHLPRVWVRLKGSVGDCGDNLVAAKGPVRWICRGNPSSFPPPFSCFILLEEKQWY